jgi:hypothetical protein
MKEYFGQFWNWLQIRFFALWTFLKWLFHEICCCGLCLEEDELEKGRTPQGKKNKKQLCTCTLISHIWALINLFFFTNLQEQLFLQGLIKLTYKLKLCISK